MSTTSILTMHCPSWCPLPADHDPQDAADGGRHHPAPTFGLLTGMTWDDGGEGWHVEASAIFQNTDAGEVAAELRDLAASALAAAEWLEANCEITQDLALSRGWAEAN